MPYLRKNSVILVKIETTEGTYNAPSTSTDTLIVAQDVSYKPETVIIPRAIIGPGFGRKQSIAAEKLGRVTFKTEIIGGNTSGTAAAGVAPAWGLLLRACGFKIKTTSSTSIQYDPVTNPASYNGADDTDASGNVALTLQIYEDGVLKILRGCRGTVRITGEHGKPVMCEWEFMGIQHAVSSAYTQDVTYPSMSTGYDALIPPLLESATFTFHSSSSLLVGSVSIDIGNTLTPRYDINSTSGVKSIFISDRRVTGTIDPEQPSAATMDLLTKMNTNAIGSFSMTLGSTAGNTIAISCPSAYCQIADVSEADRDGLLTNTLNLEFNNPLQESATNKEIRVLIT